MKCCYYITTDTTSILCYSFFFTFFISLQQSTCLKNLRFDNFVSLRYSFKGCNKLSIQHENTRELFESEYCSYKVDMSHSFNLAKRKKVGIQY